MSNNDWRQYGGIRKQNKFHNLTIGTLVADTILLRESYSGSYEIHGTIIVDTDADIYGNLISKNSTFSALDLCIGRDAYINKKLFFGQGDPLANNIEGDIFGINKDVLVPQSDTTTTYLYGSTTGISVNTTKPTSVFDINGINETKVLTVRNSNTSIQSILSQNVNGKGLLLSSNDTTTSFVFFNNNTIASNKPDVLLQNSNGTLNIASSHSSINTTGNSTFTNSNMTVNTTNLFSIRSNTVSIVSQNIQLLSKINVSSRNNPVNICNETAIIYDISNGQYLYDNYESSTNNTGNALSLVANDNSSNTFMNIIAPNKLGIGIGGGSYVKDTRRAFGTIGIVDISGNYKPNHSVVSGNTTTKYFTTMGVNTYAPRTDNYIMDINGPTHISNGEINKLKDFTFQITNVTFPKTNKTTAIAVGSSSTTNSPYNQFISYTKNGGLTWSLSRVDTTSNLETFTRFMSGYMYDSTIAVIASSNSFFYFTNDGGISWKPFYFYLDHTDRTITSIYISALINNPSPSIKRIFTTYVSFGIPRILFFDIDFSTSYTVINYTLRVYYTINSNLTTINNMDGYGDYFYAVGNGIQKYQVTTNVITPNILNSIYTINTNYVYNSVYAYSDKYAIAVGTNVISYTVNGTQWTTINTVSAMGTSMNLKSIHIYNTLYAVAVGDNGSFIYTNNGSITWQIVPNSILNTAGNASIINGTNNSLVNILMYDLNSMLITSVKQNFIQTSYSDGSTTMIPGFTKLYYCYIPNLFNRANNTILEVSGNMVMSGDMNINDGGKLITNNSTFSLLNENVQNMYFAGSSPIVYIGSTVGTVYMNNIVDVSNSLILRKGMTSMGDITFNSRLFVGMDTSLNGNLYAGGRTILNGDASLNGNLNINGQVSMNNKLAVTGNTIMGSDVTMNRNMYVFNDSSLNGNLYVGGKTTNNNDVTMNSNLFIGNTITAGNILRVQGDASFNNNVYIDNDLLINGMLKVQQYKTNLTVYTVSYEFIVVEDMSVNGRLYVANDVSFSGKFYVDDLTILNKDVSMNRQLFVQNDVSLNRNLYVDELTILNKDVSMNNNLYVKKDASFNGNVYVNGTTTNNGQVNMNSSLYVAGKTVVNSDVSLNNRLFLQNDASFGGRLFIVNDVTMMSKLFLTNDLSVNSRLFLTGFAALKNGLSVVNDASINGNLILGKNLTVNNTVNVLGNTTIKGHTQFLSDVSINGFIDATFPDESIPFSALAGGLAFASGNFNSDIAASGNLLIDTDSTFGTYGSHGNVTAYGNVMVQQNLTVSPYTNTGAFTTTLLQGKLQVDQQAQFNSNMNATGNTTLNYVNVLTDSSLNGRVLINGDISMNAKAFINGDATINGNMILNSKFIGQSDISLNGRFFSSGDISLNSRLFINSDTSMNGNVSMGSNLVTNGNMTAIGNLIVNGDASFNRRLFVNGDASFNGNLNITTNGTTITVTSTNINVYDGVSQHYDVSTSKLINIKNTTEDVQSRLTDLTARTQYIKSNSSDGNTKMKFDTGNNNIVIYSNIVPYVSNVLTLGSPTSYFNSAYISLGTLHFVGDKGEQAALSYNTDTG